MKKITNPKRLSAGQIWLVLTLVMVALGFFGFNSQDIRKDVTAAKKAALMQEIKELKATIAEEKAARLEDTPNDN